MDERSMKRRDKATVRLRVKIELGRSKRATETGEMMRNSAVRKEPEWLRRIRAVSRKISRAFIDAVDMDERRELLVTRIPENPQLSNVFKY